VSFRALLHCAQVLSDFAYQVIELDIVDQPMFRSLSNPGMWQRVAAQRLPYQSNLHLEDLSAKLVDDFAKGPSLSRRKR
jgi:hypothetical protein